MGKTPKEKVNERRRPYNSLRNTQAQGQFTGNETRNYYYSSGSVQRLVPYHRLRAAASPKQFYRGPFRGELYKDRVSNIPKLGKPLVRKRFQNNKLVSPAKRNMQCDSEDKNSQQKDSTDDLTQQQQQQQSKEGEHSLKNALPENKNYLNEDKEKMENGLTGDTEERSEKAVEQESGNLDDNSAPKAKSSSKEKKARKNETSKPKGKHSPKPTKVKKNENIEAKKNEKTEVEAVEVDIETKDKKVTKQVRKEAETEQITQQVSAHDYAQPTVKVLRLNPQLLVDAEMNDSSIMEVPIEDAEEKQSAQPSTSSDWPPPTNASPRRSTRLQEQKNTHDDSVIIVQKNDQEDSILVLENESVYVKEGKSISFAEALSNIKGRRSIRPLPPLNLPSRSHTAESQFLSFNKSKGSGFPSVASNADPVGQELKSRSFTSIFHKSSKCVTTATSDLAADNDLEDAANSSSTEESGTEADATPLEQSSTATDMNVSGKRKISNIQSVDEVQHEHKRFRSINEEQINSSGFLSVISSPMNALFASRIKIGKSSTPVHLVKVSPLGDSSHLTEEVSDIKEQTDENGENFIEKSEKENLEVTTESQSSQIEAAQKKWCSIM